MDRDIQMLRGIENFAAWKRDLEEVIDLLYCIEVLIPDGQNQIPRLLYAQISYLVSSIIKKSIPESLRELIAGRPPIKIMARLSERYSLKGAAVAVIAYQKLLDVKQEESISDYLDKIEKLRNACVATGGAIDTRMTVNLVLCGLQQKQKGEAFKELEYYRDVEDFNAFKRALIRMNTMDKESKKISGKQFNSTNQNQQQGHRGASRGGRVAGPNRAVAAAPNAAQPQTSDQQASQQTGQQAGQQKGGVQNFRRRMKKCSFCERTGHTVDTCYTKHSRPPVNAEN